MKGQALQHKSQLLRQVRNYLAGLGKHSLHYIHIGKTGGTTTRTVMRLLNSQQSHSHFVTHSHRDRPEDLPKGADYFVSIRSPDQRFISGWQYAQFGRAELSPQEKETFQVFPNLNIFLESLSPSSGLFESASEALNQLRSRARNFDLEYYFGPHDGEIIRPPIWILDIESLWEDLSLMARELANIDLSTIQTFPIHSRESPPLSETLSVTAQQNLNKLVQKDMVIYKKLKSIKNGSGFSASR